MRMADEIQAPLRAKAGDAPGMNMMKRASKERKQIPASLLETCRIYKEGFEDAKNIMERGLVLE